MSFVLKNDFLTVLIEAPCEKYQGSRFDWNGTVVELDYKRVPLLSAEKFTHDEDVRIHGRGLHNEFGIRDCIGYDDVEVGGWFPKIGTGWLKKDDEPYFFYKNYELKPLDFTYEQKSDTEAVFNCFSGEINGYSYKYKKNISIKDSSLKISYELENCGKKELHTTEYVHNFILFNNKCIDSDISLSFPWKLDVSNLRENVNTSDVMDFFEYGFSFKAKPTAEFFLGGVWQPMSNVESGATAAWFLEDKASGIKLSETGSFPLYNCDVWGHGNVISPELFFRFRVEPGKTVEWSRFYKVEG